MSEGYDLAVIGGGLAGIEAAITAAGAGARTIFIDGCPQPGGQYYKALPQAFQARNRTNTEKEGDVLLKMLNAGAVTQVRDALVWGVFQDEQRGGWLVAIHGEGAPKKVFARTLVLATGAYDMPVAFPGWTLPGVLTAGAALIFVKTQRVAPGKKALVAGTGPLLLSVASHLIEAGVEVPVVCEYSQPFWRAIPHVFTALGQWGRIEEGIKYLRTISRVGTPYKTGWTVVEARGKERVEEAVIAPVDRNGRPVRGAEKILAVDTVVTGFNLTPNTGLARMIGCAMEYWPFKGGWIPARDEMLQTSQPGVFAAGDGAGIGGAELALLEGRLAGMASALQTGHMTREQGEEIYARLKSGLSRQRRYAKMLGALFSPSLGLTALATDETILCRCEEITLGEVKAAVAAGARTLGEVKMVTRSGMGNCQGRMCEHSISNVIVEELAAEHATHQSVGMYSIRPPLHPLPVDVLAEAAE